MTHHTQEPVAPLTFDPGALVWFQQLPEAQQQAFLEGWCTTFGQEPGGRGHVISRHNTRSGAVEIHIELHGFLGDTDHGPR